MMRARKTFRPPSVRNPIPRRLPPVRSDAADKLGNKSTSCSWRALHIDTYAHAHTTYSNMCARWEINANDANISNRCGELFRMVIEQRAQACARKSETYAKRYFKCFQSDRKSAGSAAAAACERVYRMCVYFVCVFACGMQNSNQITGFCRIAAIVDHRSAKLAHLPPEICKSSIDSMHSDRKQITRANF